MIKSIGLSSTALDTSKLRESGKAKASSVVSGSTPSTSESASASPAARMAAQGAPVDLDKIAQIKAAIARGEYPVNAAAIADKMIELDLPVGY